MRRISLICAIVCVAVALALLFPAHVSSQGRRIGRLEVEDVNKREAAAREVLVRLRGPLRGPALAQVASTVDADTAEVLGRSGIVRVRSRSLGAAALLAALSKRSDVAYAEPNFIVRTFAHPDDPFFPYLWGLNNIRTAESWDTAVGSASNVIAIIDTGIDYTHPDVAQNMWSAPGPFTVVVGGSSLTCPGGSHGFNAITRSCDPMDDHNHGTHVSGTIGATGNNGIGVVGVNWTASLMGLKFLDSTGSGTVADAISAIEFAIQAKQAFAATGGANVRVLSNSWGGGGFSQALLDQINAANDHEMLFVAAAGNSGFSNDVVPLYPASYTAPNVVAVAATTSTDSRAFFSNYGAQSVHLGAPGTDILSTIRGATYGFSSGTSMATPHVSGAGGLVLSHCPLDTAQLKATLLDSVDSIPSLVSVTMTGGRLNVGKAIASCSAPPAVPTDVTAIGGDAQIRLTWSEPAGATSYRVRRSTTSGGPYTLVASNVRTLPYVDVGLVNGTTYYYVISATNLLGESADSSEASATAKAPADLIVTSLTAPAIAGAGAQLSVSITTNNQGTGTAEPSTTRFYISTNSAVDPGDTQLTQVQSVGTLIPGASVTETISLAIPADLAPNVYYLIAKADADDLLFESQEGNNTRPRVIAVGPDLLISTLTAPTTAAPGAAIVASYSVRNQGGATASGSLVRFYWSANSTLDAGDTLLESRDVALLAPETSFSSQATLTVPPGTGMGSYYLIAEADSSKAIQECRETNNTASRVVHVGGDLVIAAFTVPAAFAAGASFIVGETTKNQGTSSVASSVTHFYLSIDPILTAADTLLGSRSIAPLTAGEMSAASTTLTIPPGIGPGSYYLFAKADGGNSVQETQEANNSASKGIAIGPDLTVASLSVASRVPAGSITVVSDSVTNKGGADTGPSSLRYFLSTNAALDSSDLLLTENRAIPSLAAGVSSNGSTSLTIPAGTTPGDYYVIAKADADGSVSESLETNNTRARFVRVE